MIKVFIVDHHGTEQLGMRRILDHASDVQVIGVAHSPKDALEQLSSLEIDVVVADLRMDEMDGIAFTRRIKEDSPGVAVLIVTAYAEYDRNVALAKQAGADGFLSKDLVSDGLVEGVRTAAKEDDFFEER